MNSSQLKAFTQNNLNPHYNQMKGSLLKNNPSKLLQPHRTLKSFTIFIQPHSQQFSSSPKILCHSDEENNIMAGAHYKSEICKTKGRVLMSPGLTKRVNTSVKVHNYARTQPKPQESAPRDTKTPQNDTVNEVGNRYQFCQFIDFESQSRMSLSSFHQNCKTMRLKKLGAKTQEEIANFKLEGSHLQANQPRNKKAKTTKDPIANLYITQQNHQPTFNKQNDQKSNTARVRNIINRIQQQQPKQKPNEEAGQVKKTKSRAISASYRKHERKSSAKDRQSIHVNIINFVEQREINHPIDFRTPFNQVYNKFAKTYRNNITDVDKEQTGINPQKRIEIIPNFQRLRQVSELKNSTLDNHQSKHNKRNNLKLSGREVDSTAQIKFKRRKSILQSYTFKKQASSSSKIKPQQTSPEDFHVSGWNNSTEFERRQLIMLV